MDVCVWLIVERLVHGQLPHCPWQRQTCDQQHGLHEHWRSHPTAAFLHLHCHGGDLPVCWMASPSCSTVKAFSQLCFVWYVPFSLSTKSEATRNKSPDRIMLGSLVQSQAAAKKGESPHQKGCPASHFLHLTSVPILQESIWFHHHTQLLVSTIILDFRWLPMMMI